VLENFASNAERRALVTGDALPAARISDVYAALPAITGKFELEYEGELRGADTIGRELIRASVGNVFQALADTMDTARMVEWFNAGWFPSWIATWPGSCCSCVRGRRLVLRILRNYFCGDFFWGANFTLQDGLL
jgi:hypothetical protein